MLILICLLIAALSSFIGSISGIGGGIIIKPVLDLSGQLPMSTVNFLSGVTVLTMSTVTLTQYLIRLRQTKSAAAVVPAPDLTQPKVNGRQLLFLCLGSVAGGLLGTELFSLFLSRISSQQLIVLIQAVLILFITIAVMIYQANIARIRPLALCGFKAEFACGLALGLISSFLGIGGGPLNVAVLAYVFAHSPKLAALSSLAVIFSAQFVSLISTIAQNRVPDFRLSVLLVMMGAAVTASLIGRAMAAGMDEVKTRRFFNIVLWLILAINLYNVLKQWMSM